MRPRPPPVEVIDLYCVKDASNVPSPRVEHTLTCDGVTESRLWVYGGWWRNQSIMTVTDDELLSYDLAGPFRGMWTWQVNSNDPA